MESLFSIKQTQEQLIKGELTCSDLVAHYLKQIDEKVDLNVFLEVFAEEALAIAKAQDEALKTGKKLGKLFGVVIAIKDVICYEDHKVSAASKILDGFESLFSSTAVKNLLNEDAIIIGRVNCDEFAMGSTNENSAFGAVKNAYNTSKVPGGSSGGSAVAVQAGLCLVALGSDTGGSVRQPASFCNVVGIKSTYGRVSRHGLIAYASSFDQIAPLCHCVEDAAIVLEIISGPDEFDATAVQDEVPPYSQLLEKEGPRKIAYFKEALDHPGLDPEIKAGLIEKMEILKEEGHIVEPVSFPYLDYIVSTYYILTTAEASSNLSRFDGIRFGYRTPNANDMESTYCLSRTEGFGKEVQRRIILGTFVLSAGYYDAYYSKAQKVRRLLQNSCIEIFKYYDFILTPTTPTTAFDLGDKKYQDPIALYLADIFTVLANLVGMPAVSLPLFKHSNGLPFGLQLMAGKLEEAKLLAFSKELMDQQTKLEFC